MGADGEALSHIVSSLGNPPVVVAVRYRENA